MELSSAGDGRRVTGLADFGAVEAASDSAEGYPDAIFLRRSAGRKPVARYPR